MWLRRLFCGRDSPRHQTLIGTRLWLDTPLRAVMGVLSRH
jgi:hypothetical protein